MNLSSFAARVRQLAILAAFIVVAIFWSVKILGHIYIPCTSQARAITGQTANIQYLWSTCAEISIGASGLLTYQDNLIVSDYMHGAVTDYMFQSGNEIWTASVQGSLNLVLDVPRKRVYTNILWGTARDIYALDIASGQVAWVNRVNDGKHINYEPLLLSDGRIIAMAAPSNGVTIYGGIPTDVYPIDPDTGNYLDKIRIASAFVFADGYAWQVNKGYLEALDALTGQTVYHASEPLLDQGCDCLNDVQSHATTILAQYGSRQVSTLEVFDLITGTRRWVYTVPYMVGHAALTNDYVYVLDLKATLHIFDTQTGTEVGQIVFKPAASGHDDYLLDSNSISSSELIANDNHLVAIDFGDTKVLSVYRLITSEPTKQANS